LETIIRIVRVQFTSARQIRDGSLIVVARGECRAAPGECGRVGGFIFVDFRRRRDACGRSACRRGRRLRGGDRFGCRGGRDSRGGRGIGSGSFGGRVAAPFAAAPPAAAPLGACASGGASGGARPAGGEVRLNTGPPL